MKPKLHANGLSAKANRCVTTAGIPADKEVVLHALKTGKLFPFCWPINYEIYTHREVCRWAGVDPTTLPLAWSHSQGTPFPDNGLSYRANNCLSQGGISPTKESVIHGLRAGRLSSGNHIGGCQLKLTESGKAVSSRGSYTKGSFPSIHPDI